MMNKKRIIATRKGRNTEGRKKLIVSILIAAGALHVGAIIIAGFFVIARNLLLEPPALEVKTDIKFPAKVRKHRIEMRQVEMARPKVSAHELLKTVQPTVLSLPSSLPKFHSEALSGLATEFTTDSEPANGVGWSPAPGQSNFFGVGTEAKRILILYDISKTVVNAATRTAIPMEVIRKESCRLIEELGIQCRFGLAQFARNYAFFNDTLLPATDENRRRAKDWLNRWFATTGMMPPSTPNLVSGSPGFLEVLDRAFRAQPEVIYILSDGGFYRQGGPIPYEKIQSALHVLQKKRTSPVKIHFLAVGMKDDRFQHLRKILSAYGGTIRKL